MAKTIKSGLLEREYRIDPASLNRDLRGPEDRTVLLSFSSETPVMRHFPEYGRAMEVLDHSPDSVDLSEMRDSAPLLVGHNTDDQVGVVELAEVGPDKKARARVRFGRSARATEIFNDVMDGIRPKISVGYRVGKYVEDGKDGETPILRAMKWTPKEISIVAIPADKRVGVGRSNVDDPQFEIRVETENSTITVKETKPPMATELPVIPAAPTPTPGLEARTSEIPDFLLNDDVRQIRATANHYKGTIKGIEDLARVAEFDGLSFVQFRQLVRDRLPKPEPIKETPITAMIHPDQIQKHYSLSRAIAMRAEGHSLNGLERELSDEITKRHGRSPGGFWIPPDVMVMNMQRSFVAGTGTLGGNLVQTSNLGQDFIEVLRNKAQVMALGARTLQLDTPVTIPRQAAAGAVNWVGETVASTLNVGNFDQISLTPRGVSANMQYAKQLLITNNPSIDSLIRDDIMNIVALAIDLAALHGTGTNQPTGIIGTSGIGSVALATNGQALGNSTAYSAMVSLETLLSTPNADIGALAYLARSSHRGSLKLAQRFTSTDSPVWTTAQVPGNQPGVGRLGGAVNGYRAEVTNQIATNITTGTATTICSAIFFGNWNELLIGQFNGGATDLVVDPFTAGANAVIRLYARHWCDIGVRHAASFAVLGGIL